ncbi:MAG: FIST C-terminal domain-containing protein [Treponema sp.]|jgi:hypothetical protein|nr:FIST C-terminal domain-containing protein [Treponema sp.]
MRSKVNVAMQVDDIDAAVDELLAGIGTDFPLGSSSAGILLCYSDMEIAALAKALKAKAGFDIIGCSCIANMDRDKGFHSMAITLTVLTADDCVFSAQLSEKVSPGAVYNEVKNAYDKVRVRLGGAPGLIVAIPPYILEIMLDAYTMAFNEAAPGIPIVGGLPSFNSTGDFNVTIFNDKIYEDCLVMLAIKGNISPVFSVQNVVGTDVERKRKVTKAKGNVVYTVGNQSFTDYLHDSGLPVEQLVHGNNTITFVSNPILLESGDGGFSFARTLHEINPENGSGTAIGMIPEGAILSICSLEREQIQKGAVAGMRALREKMKAREKEGGAYSTVLAFSCIGRNLLMLPNNDAEVRQLLTEFPGGLTLSGFYGYGEIGPQGLTREENFAHNESLILCAF